MKKIILFLFSILLLSGCAYIDKKIYVEYFSNPKGAMICEGDRNFGVAPIKLYFQLTDDDIKNGFKVCEGIRAVWISGAESSTDRVKCDIDITTSTYSWTFTRPDNFPDIDKDLQFALEIERNELMGRQASAEESQAYWQRYQALNPPKPKIEKKYIYINR